MACDTSTMSSGGVGAGAARGPWDNGAVIASAFAVVFAVFVVAFVVLCGVIVAWAVRRDRARWREWRERRDG